MVRLLVISCGTMLSVKPLKNYDPVYWSVRGKKSLMMSSAAGKPNASIRA